MKNIQGYPDQFGELTTFISVPKRGKYGNANYRGNYAGEVLAKLVRFLQTARCRSRNQKV